MLLLIFVRQIHNFEGYQNDLSTSRILMFSNDANTSLRTSEGKIIVNYIL